MKKFTFIFLGCLVAYFAYAQVFLGGRAIGPPVNPGQLADSNTFYITGSNTTQAVIRAMPWIVFKSNIDAQVVSVASQALHTAKQPTDADLTRIAVDGAVSVSTNDIPLAGVTNISFVNGTNMMLLGTNVNGTLKLYIASIPDGNDGGGAATGVLPGITNYGPYVLPAQKTVSGVLDLAGTNSWTFVTATNFEFSFSGTASHGQIVNLSISNYAPVTRIIGTNVAGVYDLSVRSNRTTWEFESNAVTTLTFTYDTNFNNGGRWTLERWSGPEWSLKWGAGITSTTNGTTREVEVAASGSATAINDLGDATGDGGIALGGNRIEFSSTKDTVATPYIFYGNNTDAAVANETFWWLLEFTVDADPQAGYLLFRGDSGGAPTDKYRMTQTAFNVGGGVGINFGDATSFEVPNAAAPSTTVAGQLALDTTITDHKPLLQYYTGADEMLVIAVPRAQLTSSDTHVVAYSAANDRFEMVAPSAGSGDGDATIAILRQTVVHFEDFLWTVSAAGDPNGMGVFAMKENKSGTGAEVEGTSGSTNAPGLVRLNAGTTTTGYAGVRSHETSIVPGFATYTNEWRVRINDLPTEAESYTARFGFGDTTTGTVGTDAILITWSTNHANYILECRSNGTSTTLTNTTAVATGFVKLGIVVNADATSVSFTINGSDAQTITTNIPKGDGRGMGLSAFITKDTGTTARTLDVDYAYLSYSLSAAR